MDTDTGFNIASNSYPVLNKLRGFNERITYDGNGNIQKYLRSNVGYEPIMDSLTYSYYPGTNQLLHVRDSIPDSKWGSNDWDFIIDIDNQKYWKNYEYDSIGNLIRDSAERIWKIKWNVYGKIEEINRYAGPKSPFTKIKYYYDASGNRIGKEAEYSGDKLYEWYVRDAQGNILSVYNSSGYTTDLSTLGLSQVERTIYGSSRLGSVYGSQGVDGSPWDAKQYFTNGVVTRGLRQYELSNHLGNVLTTITDRKFGVSSNGSLIDYYEPDMVSAADYYAFGSLMRSAAPQAYRFGFNGKENDNEVKGGEGLQQDYGMRVYDNRLGRFLSVDPLADDYPSWSPYPFAMNRPIDGIDLDGLEWKSVKDKDENVTDYEYVGFDEKGNPKPGSEAAGMVVKGGTTYMYGSEVSGKNPETGTRFSRAFLTIFDNDASSITSISIADRAYSFGVKYSSLSTGVTLDYNVSSGPQAPNRIKHGFTGVTGTGLELEALREMRFVMNTTPPGGGIESLGLGPAEFLIGAGEMRLFGKGLSALGKTIGKSLPRGGLDFADYVASRGGTETLEHILTTNKAGQTVFQRISTEYHHAIITQRTQRLYKLPNWLVNNRINVWKLNTVQHSLIDPYRFKFLRFGFKSEVGWFNKYNWFTKFGK